MMRLPIQLIVSLEIANSDDNESITIKQANPQQIRMNTEVNVTQQKLSIY